MARLGTQARSTSGLLESLIARRGSRLPGPQPAPRWSRRRCCSLRYGAARGRGGRERSGEPVRRQRERRRCPAGSAGGRGLAALWSGCRWSSTCSALSLGAPARRLPRSLQRLGVITGDQPAALAGGAAGSSSPASSLSKQERVHRAHAFGSSDRLRRDRRSSR